MKTTLRSLLTLTLMAAALQAHARLTGTNDWEFQTGAGVSGSYVHALVVEPDDKVVIGGSFSFVAGVKRMNVARLLANGSLDSSFNTSNGPNSEILSLARQPDGKILIGGNFTYVGGVPRPRIARLNADGSVDASFNNTGIGPNGEVRAIGVQEDGKLLIGGFFSNFNHTNRNSLARLHPDGRLDTSFSFGTGPGGVLFSIVLQADRRIVVAGEFTTFSGQTRGSVARLLPTGALDASFDPGKGVDGWVGTVRLQPDGKVLVVGDFNAFAGTPRSRIVRLNVDGTLDTTFNPGAGVSSDGFSLVHSVAVDHDGSIIIGGLFTRVGGVSRPYLARLETDGTLDRTFTPAVDAAVRMLAFNSLGRLVVGGEFARVNGKPNSRIGRLGAPGDSGFLAPGFSNLRREASGCYVTFRGPAEARSRVQCSTNLVDWVDCLEVGAGAVVRLSETNNPDCGGKFFRAVVQPTVLSQVPAAAR